MEQRAAAAEAFVQTIRSTITTLEGMKVHLQGKAQTPEPAPAVTQIAQPLMQPAWTGCDEKLAAFQALLKSCQLSSEMEAKLNDSAQSMLQVPMLGTQYGKAPANGGPAAAAAQSGPYQAPALTTKDLEAEKKTQQQDTGQT